MNEDERRRFEQVVARVAPGSRLVRAWRLEGGVSAEVTGLEIARPDGALEKALVRRHGLADLAANPNIAADEYRLLESVYAAGLPAPEPLFLDTSCELFPTPYLVVEFIEGAPEMAPADPLSFARELAAILARIHSVDWSGVDFAFLPRRVDRVARLLAERPAQLDERLSESHIRAALESRWPPTQGNEPRLLHGDFWPGNLLWRDGELAAIVDWEDAAWGDPLADLGNSRLEILWFFGPEAMDAFTDAYRELLPDLNYADLPLWDLYAALRPAGKLWDWGLDPKDERRMVRLHRSFVEQALARLTCRDR